MANYKLFDVERHGEFTVMRWTAGTGSRTLGEHEMETAINDFLAQESASRVVVSFSRLAHCRTEIIAGVVSLKKRLLRTGGRLAVCDINETVRDKLCRLNLLPFFEVQGAIPEAITASRRVTAPF